MSVIGERVMAASVGRLQGAFLPVARHAPPITALAAAGRRTRNHAAYSAGRNTSVSTVATTMPPIIATAIGPKKSLRVSGIIASTAAAAVSTIGRKRRTVAPTIASHGAAPAAMSCSIWSTRITELRMMMPDSAIVPSIATKPNGLPKASSASVTPISPSGAVSTTIAMRAKL